jgi:hypothetical protein
MRWLDEEELEATLIVHRRPYHDCRWHEHCRLRSFFVVFRPAQRSSARQ